METKKGGTKPPPGMDKTNPFEDLERDAKVSIKKDLFRVWSFFCYTTATTLQCAFFTGILRNSITWHVSVLESLGLLQAVRRAPDPYTHHTAKYYSANPDEWKQSKRPQVVQLTLNFG